jgi:hypothetical protein
MSICVYVKEAGPEIYGYSIAYDVDKLVHRGVLHCVSTIEASVRVVNVALAMFTRDIVLYTFSKYVHDLLAGVPKRRGQRSSLALALSELSINAHRIRECIFVHRHSAKVICKVALRHAAGEDIREKDWSVML